MRRFFLIAAILFSTTTAYAGLDTTVASADDVRAPEAAQSSSAQRPDPGALAAKREAMIQQKMAMQKEIMMRKQMAMQREMQRHPIRTRLHFAVLKFKRQMNSVLH